MTKRVTVLVLIQVFFVGQKQRVSLARVLYANPDVALLDDVFSALDAGTGDAVYNGLFGKNGMLKTQATIVVTHATKFLQKMDCILVLSQGEAAFCGTYSELQHSKGHSAVEALVQNLTADVSEDSKKEANTVGGHRVHDDNNEEGKEQLIMTKEDREFGLSKFKTWLIWFQYAGGWTYFLLQVMFLIIDRALYVSSEW